LIWKARRFCFDITDRFLTMGILNVTPDSFFDGGKYFDLQAAVEHGQQMMEDGADIIDVGGESTRPGSESITPDEQIRRIAPVIDKLASLGKALISVDTTSAEVAKSALENGAVIVNDISCLSFDSGMGDLIVDKGAGLIAMHIKGTPKTMQKNPTYQDLFAEIALYFTNAIQNASSHGIMPESIAIDPGIGFAKTSTHNLAILKRLDKFKVLGRPILIGPSRKSFIGACTGAAVEDRLSGTAAAIAAAILAGADIIRVHDVKAMRQAAQVAFAIRETKDS